MARTALGGRGSEATRISACFRKKASSPVSGSTSATASTAKASAIVFQAFADFLLLKRRLARSA